jgi:hypothetical protein
MEISARLDRTRADILPLEYKFVNSKFAQKFTKIKIYFCIVCLLTSFVNSKFAQSNRQIFMQSAY